MARIHVRHQKMGKHLATSRTRSTRPPRTLNDQARQGIGRSEAESQRSETKKGRNQEGQDCKDQRYERSEGSCFI